MSLHDHLLQQLLARQPQRLIVAYSGGLDSHVLLHAVAALRNRLPGVSISALHVHHGISAQADAWEAHCRQVCADLQVALTVRRVAVSQRPGPSLEDKARRARYEVFEQLLTGERDWLLLGQHQDDQAETVLLRLLRGAGPTGLAGMPQERRLGAGRLLRPWLNVPRARLMAYAQTHALRWVEDESNADQAIDRNFLRHTVLPALQARWPHAAAAFSRSAELCRDAEQLNQTLAAQDLAAVQGPSADSLRVSALRRLSPARQANVLRYWLASLQWPVPDGRQLRVLQDEVLGAREDAMPLLRWSGCEARRYRDLLYVMSPLQPHDAAWQAHWPLPQPLSLPTGTLQAEACVGAGLYVPPGARVTVSYRQGGERCQLAGQRGSKALKKLLQDAGVPPWLRNRLPLIRVNGELAAIADRWLCAPFAAAAGQAGWRLRWRDQLQTGEPSGARLS